MDISAERTNSDTNRPHLLSTVLHTVPGVLKWLLGFFMLTKEDEMKAGIHMGSEEIDQ